MAPFENPQPAAPDIKQTKIKFNLCFRNDYIIYLTFIIAFTIFICIFALKHIRHGQYVDRT